MHRNLPHGAFLLVVTMLAATGAVAKSIALAPLARYEGDGLRLRVDRMTADDWSGSITLGDATYPFTAKSANSAGGVKLTGTFTADGDAFPFTATQPSADADLTLASGGATYRLRLVGGPARMPAPDGGGGGAAGKLPAELKLKKVDFRDVDMNNVVACTMLVPDGWAVEGQVKWSRGDSIYPQKMIQVKSPDGLQKVSFVPGMNFTYSETDPAWLAQIQQLGVPHQLKERDGTPPPQDLGEWLASYVSQTNPSVGNAKVVRQERDLPKEEAIKKAFPGLNAGGDSKIMVLGFEYDDAETGRRMRDETSATIIVLPPIEGHPTRYQMWSLYIHGIVTAPADRFEQSRPLLYAVADTLRDTPQWWNAVQQTLAQISAMRHRANMDQIAAWGAAMRKAGETYSQMSDDAFASWKRRDASNDEVQRKSINAINETEDYKLPPNDPYGAEVKLPSLYENVYRPTDGDYFILTNKTLDSPNLTKLEPVRVK
jgi:hypothetical protein